MVLRTLIFPDFTDLRGMGYATLAATAVSVLFSTTAVVCLHPQGAPPHFSLLSWPSPKVATSWDPERHRESDSAAPLLSPPEATVHASADLPPGPLHSQRPSVYYDARDVWNDTASEDLHSPLSVSNQHLWWADFASFLRDGSNMVMRSAALQVRQPLLTGQLCCYVV